MSAGNDGRNLQPLRNDSSNRDGPQVGQASIRILGFGLPESELEFLTTAPYISQRPFESTVIEGKFIRQTK
jgi:hypothetical protein